MDERNGQSNTQQAPYPEHERMAAVSEQSQALGDFLMWLQEQGIELARWETTKPCDNAAGPVVDLHGPSYESGRKWRCEGGRLIGHPKSNKPGQVGGECDECAGTGVVERIEPRLVPIGARIETLLAQRFDIDLDVIEAEKRQMLDTLRARAAAR